MLKITPDDNKTRNRALLFLAGVGTVGDIFNALLNSATLAVSA